MEEVELPLPVCLPLSRGRWKRTVPAGGLQFCFLHPKKHRALDLDEIWQSQHNLHGLTVDPHPVIVTVRDKLGSSYVPMLPLFQGGGPPKQCQKNLKMLQVHAWFGCSCFVRACLVAWTGSRDDLSQSAMEPVL